jgi:hypothetical protein
MLQVVLSAIYILRLSRSFTNLPEVRGSLQRPVAVRSGNVMVSAVMAVAGRFFILVLFRQYTAGGTHGKIHS